MCDLAVFTWGVFSSMQCLGVVQLGDLSRPYGCDFVEFDAQTARGNLYGFTAEVSCVPYVVFEETSEYSNSTYLAYNTSDSILGTFSVPTLSSKGGGGGYGPGALKNQTLRFNDISSTCFTQAGDELAQQLYPNSTSLGPFFLGDDPSQEYCPNYHAVGGAVEPLECCIGEIDVVLDWETKFAASMAAGWAGGLLVLYLICRGCIQCCFAKCCCCLPKSVMSGECCCCKEQQGDRVFTAKNIATTGFRCVGVSLALFGYGFNAMVTARYFTTRTIVLGVIYEGTVGFLEGFSAFWIGDGFPLNDTGRKKSRRRSSEKEKKRRVGVVCCTMVLIAYLVSVGVDIDERQTCGVSNTHVMFMVGVGAYAVLGAVVSCCRKSLGYAQQLFTDMLAPWPALVTTFSCEPLVKSGVIVLAMVLGWVGTALVAVYGDTVASVA